jgi:NRAMP (natural resistance-associated macrophage protein)-like metal ion transporter
VPSPKAKQRPDPKVEELERTRNPVLKVVKSLGPGFITGASDDDPSGIGTYASAGASFGYGLLWTALVTFPLQATVQFICAKIGLVTGRGLAGVIRQHYPRWVLYPAVIALVVANTVNVGADLGAVAAAINMLVPGLPIIPLIFPIAFAILAMVAFGSYRIIERIFRWLAFVLLAYIGAAVLARPDWGEVVRSTFVPQIQLDPAFIAMLVAVPGTTISPYLFFWQTSHEVEEEVSIGRAALRQRRGATDRELGYAALDVNAGMAFSHVIMYAVILATASTLHISGQTNIGSATEAAQALRPLAGDLSTVLFAIGLIGGGVLAIPILSASAAYAVSEMFGWKLGLDRPPGRAKQFYAVIAAATLVGAGINYAGINPIDALFIAAVVNGLVAPLLLVLLMVVSNNRSIMGDRTNSSMANLFGWAAAGVMSLAALALIAVNVLG